MFLLIKAAICRDRLFAASLIILGPKPSSSVALDGSNLWMYDATWSMVIKWILKWIFSGTLSFTNFWSLVTFRSEFVFSRICAIEVKYTLNLVVIVSESVKCSPSMIISSGSVLPDDVDPLFTALKCFHRVLVSLNYSMDFVKCCRIALRIKFLVLFR